MGITLSDGPNKAGPCLYTFHLKKEGDPFSETLGIRHSETRKLGEPGMPNLNK
jgi:hypothetical protein